VFTSGIQPLRLPLGSHLRFGWPSPLCWHLRCTKSARGLWRVLLRRFTLRRHYTSHLTSQVGSSTSRSPFPRRVYPSSGGNFAGPKLGLCSPSLQRLGFLLSSGSVRLPYYSPTSGPTILPRFRLSSSQTSSTPTPSLRFPLLQTENRDRHLPGKVCSEGFGPRPGQGHSRYLRHHSRHHPLPTIVVAG